VLTAYDQLFGLELEPLAVDGCTTKAPCSGQVAGPSQPPRRRALAATLNAIAAVGPLPAQPVVHRDAGYDYQPCRQVLAERGWSARSPCGASQPRSRPGAVGDRAHPRLGHQEGKLGWSTERRRLVVAFWLVLANAVIVCGSLVRRA
jgi:hypothetical protein